MLTRYFEHPYTMKAEHHGVPTDSSNALSIMQRLRRGGSLLFFGTPSLDSLLQNLETSDSSQWSQFKGRLTDRTTNINTVGALYVAALASFLTSSPPTNVGKWDHDVPYLFSVACYVMSALAVVSGLCLLMFLDALDSQYITVSVPVSYSRFLLRLQSTTTAGAV
ncbi:hypothetical protein EDC04DRAFT_2775572 [Pisolithus marmoratus]|nr:hypothetical protein EDC04DRAFT_2775572 [Pisolithus marmoratus]